MTPSVHIIGCRLIFVPGYALAALGQAGARIQTPSRVDFAGDITSWVATFQQFKPDIHRRGGADRRRLRALHRIVGQRAFRQSAGSRIAVGCIQRSTVQVRFLMLTRCVEFI